VDWEIVPKRLLRQLIEANRMGKTVAGLPTRPSLCIPISTKTMWQGRVACDCGTADSNWAGQDLWKTDLLFYSRICLQMTEADRVLFRRRGFTAAVDFRQRGAMGQFLAVFARWALFWPGVWPIF